MSGKKKKNSNVSSSGGGSGGEAQNPKVPTKTPTNITQATRDNPKPQPEGETKEPTVDMKSVIALGYGPISASKLNSLVASGEVIEYKENGKLKYKKAPKPITANDYLVKKYQTLYKNQ